jgi:hypothetical protein
LSISHQGFAGSARVVFNDLSITGEWRASSNFFFGDKLLIDSQAGQNFTGWYVTSDIPNRWDPVSNGIVSQDFSGSVNISFTRTGPGFVQKFKGKAERICKSTACPPLSVMYGSFTHNSSGLYPWYAAR